MHPITASTSPGGGLDILVVEDHPCLAASIHDFLELHGHRIDAAANGVLALHLLGQHEYDVAVIDWMLPRLDGIGLLDKLRVGLGLQTPVIMLTARSSLADKVAGFHAGVDDYLVKPFELAELELRCQALALRRPKRGRVLAVADLRLDLDTLVCTRGVREVALAPATRKLLTVLMQASPRVVSRERLIDAVWPEQPPAADLLRRCIHDLRKQLARGGEQPLVFSIPGIGYVLRQDHPTETAH